MAEEARRNGGRNVPLIDDAWRPGSRAKKKRYGLRIHYRSFFSQRECSYTQWYATPDAREQALAAQFKNRAPWRSPLRFEQVER